MTDSKRCYSLFHSKLGDYLAQDEERPDKEYVFSIEEEKDWHRALAAWSEQGDIGIIWEDVKNAPAEQERREYARRHYITHLFGAEEWKRLCIMLEADGYGRAKMYRDSSSYIQDLILGHETLMSLSQTL